VKKIMMTRLVISTDTDRIHERDIRTERRTDRWTPHDAIGLAYRPT